MAIGFGNRQPITKLPNYSLTRFLPFDLFDNLGDHFLLRDEIQTKFKRVLELSKRYKINSTPLFLQFAAGQRDYPCTPWGNPTRTPKGWKGPCYLIEGGYYPTWKDFWTGVDWDYWESRRDPKCQNCLMHSGFEASVVRQLGTSRRDVWTMAKWNFLG